MALYILWIVDEALWSDRLTQIEEPIEAVFFVRSGHLSDTRSRCLCIYRGRLRQVKGH